MTDIPELRIETPTLLIIARPSVGRVSVIMEGMEHAFFCSCEEFCKICDRLKLNPPKHHEHRNEKP